MKLVELLARELVEWPDEAVAIAQDSDGGAHPYKSACLDFDGEEWIGPGELGVTFSTYNTQMDLSSDYATAIVTREMWEAERVKSEPWFASEPACCHCIEMDVEFPTVSIVVGSACSPEWNGEGLPPVGTVCEAHDYGKYRTVSIVAHDGGYALCRVGQGEYMAGNSGSFRPIRTEERVAAQERERALDDIYRIMRTVERPGNKADMAEALYAAGYRKQEKSE